MILTATEQLQKLTRLTQAQDIAIYRYSSLGPKKLNRYFFLSDVRLNVVRYGNGRVTLIEAAPVLLTVGGAPTVVFSSSNVSVIVEGARKGINILGTSVREGESCIPAHNVSSVCLTLEDLGQDAEAESDVKELNERQSFMDKVCDMARTPSIPVSRLMIPEYARLCRSLDHVKPMVNSDLKSLLGCTNRESYDAITRAFRNQASKLGFEQEPGSFVLPFSYVASGGVVVADDSMISRRSLYNLFSMPGAAFDIQTSNLEWRIR